MVSNKAKGLSQEGPRVRLSLQHKSQPETRNAHNLEPRQSFESNTNPQLVLASTAHRSSDSDAVTKASTDRATYVVDHEMSNTHQSRRQQFNGSRGPISEPMRQLVDGEYPCVALDKPPSPSTHNGHVLEHFTAAQLLIKPVWMKVQHFGPLAFIFRTQTSRPFPYDEIHEQICSVHSLIREAGGRCTNDQTTNQNQRTCQAHDSRNLHRARLFSGRNRACPVACPGWIGTFTSDYLHRADHD